MITPKNEIIVDTVFNTIRGTTYYQAKNRMTMNKYYYFTGYGSERTDVLNKLLLQRIKTESEETK